MRENLETMVFYTDLTCDIIGFERGPFHEVPEGSDCMVYYLLRFIISVYGPGRDWDSFLGLGDYIGHVIEEYEGYRDLLYDAYHRDISNRGTSTIPVEVIQGYETYWQILNILASHPNKDPETTEMAKYTHYQYLQIIQERYNARKRKMYIQRSSAPQF